MRKLLALMLVAAVFLGACNEGEGGGEVSEDAKQSLVSAFTSLGEADAQSLTLSITSDPGSLDTLSEGEVTEEQANILLNSSITIEGTKADDPADQSTRIAFNVEGTDGAEMVVVGPDLFVRADVAGFAEAFGVDQAQLQAAITQAQARFDFVGPLANGDFVKFEGVGNLAGEFGASPPDTSQQEQLVRQLADALEAEATVSSEGTDDVGEHLVASIPLRSLYQSVIDLAPQMGQSFPPGMLPPAEQIPEGDLSLDVWVADDRVAQIEFDLTQLGDFAEESGEENPFEGVEQFALRVVFSEDVGEISAPQTETVVSAQEIQAIIGSLFAGAVPGGIPGGGGGIPGGGGGIPGGGGGGGVAPGFDCSIYEGLPPETFDGLSPEILQQLEALCPGVVPK
jgi:hypothetical protein